MLIENRHPKYLDLLVKLPKKQRVDLLALQIEQDVNEEQLALRAQAILEEIDWNRHAELLGKLSSELLPIEQLVPECYADWRSIVGEAVRFIGIRLRSQRLIPKLVEQLLLPEDTAIEQRLIRFISNMPSLQKLGQVIARNRNLEPAFRAALTKLENEIRDIEPDKIKVIIEQQLGSLLKKHKVKIENRIYAEASVSALLRFSWLNPQTNIKEQGVFKVLKPQLKKFFKEEMGLLQELADFLDTKKEQHALNKVNLRAMFEDIGKLLEQEFDSEREIHNLKDAYNRYTNSKGVKIPQLFATLSAPGVIAMSFEPGKKITDISASNTAQRRVLSTHMVEAMIARPLFDDAERAVFHADPHAGNLFVNEKTQELLIFDWALTEHLSREERRKIILLMSGVLLRDAHLITQAICELSEHNIKQDPVIHEALRAAIKPFINTLPFYKLPATKDVLSLLDNLMLSGINFSTPLLMFRKVLLTLDGVLHDLADAVSIETVLSKYVIDNLRYEACGLHYLPSHQQDFKIPITNNDALSIVLSAQWYYFRSVCQANAQWFNTGR
ncbi:MAG: hypothetical protein DHS20C09_20460 [marine bacterium B5-7]|nr:MAG: hypothetical protein DHS20C09_20460 [marine bacterium B5-7]